MSIDKTIINMPNELIAIKGLLDGSGEKPLNQEEKQRLIDRIHKELIPKIQAFREQLKSNPNNHLNSRDVQHYLSFAETLMDMANIILTISEKMPSLPRGTPSTGEKRKTVDEGLQPTRKRAKKLADQMDAQTLQTKRPQEEKIGIRNSSNNNICYMNSAMQLLLHEPEILQHLEALAPDELIQVTEEELVGLSKDEMIRKKDLMQAAYHLSFLKTFMEEVKTPPVDPYALEETMLKIRMTLEKAGFSDLKDEPINSQQDAATLLLFWLDLLGAEKLELETQNSGRIESSGQGFISTKNEKTSPMLVIEATDHKTQSLDEAMAAYFRPERLDEYRYEGQSAVDVEKKTSMTSIPNSLYIRFKRLQWKGGEPTLSTQSLTFPENGVLDIQGYISHKKPFDVTQYTIETVICHSGGSKSGHYTAFKKISGQWYKFDDDHIKKVRYEDIPPNQIVTVGLKRNYIVID